MFGEVSIDKVDLAALVKEDSNRRVFEDGGCNIERGVREKCSGWSDCCVGRYSESACIA